MPRRYRFVAGDDSLDAFRRLRGGWAGYGTVDGEVHVVLAGGGGVRMHADSLEIETGFAVTSVVADSLAQGPDVAPHGSPMADGDHDVLVFAGVSWLEARPEMGDDVTVQFSGPAHMTPGDAQAVCDTTDAVAVLRPGGGGVIVRLALKPGHLEIVDRPDEVASFLQSWGYAEDE